MHSNKKRICLYLKIWITHIIFYYFLESLFFLNHIYIENTFKLPAKKIITTILGSSIIGFFGLFDGFPFFVLIPIIIMILLKLKMNSYFKSYFLSLIIAYFFLFIFYGFKTENFEFIVIGIIITMLINYLILRRTYQKLANEKK